MEHGEREVAKHSEKSISYATPIAIVVAALMLSGAWVYGRHGTIGPAGVVGAAQDQNDPGGHHEATLASDDIVTPTKGVILAATWGSLGKQLVDSGAIDSEKFQAIYKNRGQFTNEYKNLLLENSTGKIKITKENAGFYLNLFWALGLANKNVILEKGQMANPAYGGAQNFASTGGWTVAEGSPMDHYSKHAFFSLTAEQQTLVEKVAKGVYRPCCGNSTIFPDCNHGMAMLGLLELMASQGANEQDMWKAALAVNSYWFPDTYTTIAAYMKAKGIEWKDVNPQEVLGAEYSSGQGFAKISSQVVQQKKRQSSGGGCGVDAGEPVAPQAKQQPGCGV